MRISISVKGVEKVQGMLRKIPIGAKGVVAYAVALYLLGNESHGLKHYAPYKHVSRKRAYGVTFFSDKQRRWWWANQPSIPYRRTGAQGKAWGIEGRSTNVRLVNRDPSVQFTRGQTNLHRLMGWQTAMGTIRSNLKGALRAGWAALKAFIGA
jgi:hypothetical protein